MSFVYMWEKEGLAFPFALLQSHARFCIKQDGLVWDFFLKIDRLQQVIALSDPVLCL